MREKVLSLMEAIKKIQKSAGDAALKSSNAANEASGGLAQSYSAAGDAEHARNTANLSIQKAKQIINLAAEIEGSFEEGVPTAVKPVCYLSVEFGDGTTKDIFLVENPAFVEGFNLISPSSPLGEALLGKVVGDPFSYTSEGRYFEGRILVIE